MIPALRLVVCAFACACLLAAPARAQEASPVPVAPKDALPLDRFAPPAPRPAPPGSPPPVEQAMPDVLQRPPGNEQMVPLSGDELRELVSGNTVYGHHDNGMPYAEYHSPDGRVFGHNNFDPVKDGCWQVRGDAVCYSYEGGAVQGQFCWRFYRMVKGDYRILLPRTGTLGIAFVAKGNPRNFTDNGKPWTCQALLSQR